MIGNLTSTPPKYEGSWAMVFKRLNHGRQTMKRILAGTTAIALMSLTACNSSPREQAADNIEANAERVADNLEEAADNAPTEVSEDNLENRADAARDLGDKKAEDMRTNDPDTNLSNGM